jgi:hypothetical protein
VPTPPAEPQPAPENANTAPPERPETPPAGGVSPEQATREAAETLRSWAASIGSMDIGRHMAHYADVVDFYRAGPVPKRRVAAERAAAFRRFDTMEIRITRVHEVRPEPDGSRVTVVFDKAWTFQGSGRTSTGAVKQLIVLERVGGEYKIVRERDLAVY